MGNVQFHSIHDREACLKILRSISKTNFDTAIRKLIDY